MKTITFYSYKGGVGRSLSLVNIATRLSELGKRVCLLDFDLEAPGLPLKFPSLLSTANIEKGIVDYVSDFAKTGHLPNDITKYAITFQSSPKSVPIFLIPAGNIESASYWKKLSSINWHELLYENDNGIAFFLDLKSKIQSQLRPDFLLIDSRTGISEMSEISMSLLADEVVIVAANNKENLGGAKRIIGALSNPENVIFENPPKITFVLSRIPFTEKPEDRAKEAILIKKIQREYLHPAVKEVNVIHSDRELEINEQIKIAYEKDENIPQSSRDYLLLFEKLTKNDLTEAEILRFQAIRKAEHFYELAIGDKPTQEKLSNILKAIDLNPNNIDYYIYCSHLYEEFEKLEDSLKYINIALSLNSNHLVALQIKLGLLIRIKRYDDARIEIDKIFKIDKHNFFANRCLGIILTKEGHIAEAIRLYTKLKESYPDQPLVYNMLADSKRLSGDLDGALVDIYKALELNPDFGIAYGTLAEINASKGNINEFFLYLEISLRLVSREMEEFIISDPIYKQFFENDRFKALMVKYNIDINS